MKLVVDEALHPPTEPVLPGKVTVQPAGRPTAGVIARGSKHGHVAREFLRGTNAIEPCDPRQFHEAAHSWEPAERMPDDRQGQRRAAGLR